MQARDSLQWHAWHAGALTHCNGTHGMRARDSLQWHVWYAWNAGVRDSSDWNARNVELGVVGCNLC